MRVLFIGKDIGTSDLIRKELIRGGHDVVLHEDEARAFKEFQSNPFPLILLDWSKSAPGFCRQVCEEPHGNRAFILGIASQNSMAEFEEILAAGAVDCLWKPIDLPFLKLRLSVVEKMVSLVTIKSHMDEHSKHSMKMEALGRLAGGVAHDFNNMLAVIHGYAEFILGASAGNPKTLKYTNNILTAAKRSENLTRQLLAFSRKQPIEPTILSLNSCLKDSDELLKHLVGENISVHFILSNDLGAMQGDPGQISQVLFNFAVNARDAMPKGGSLSIQTKNVKLFDGELVSPVFPYKAGDYVMLSIADTGVGMGAEVKRHLFEAFFTTKDTGKGTGLGLATIFDIVQNYKGTITFESQEGVGTTFRIYFPRLPMEEEKSHSAQLLAELELPRGTESIVLVEDEDSLRYLAQDTLEQYGYTVVAARDGREALMLCDLSPSRIDLLLTDFAVPNVGGGELADILKPVHPEMKILFISGNMEDADVRISLSKHQAMLLEKPFTIRDLLLKVRKALDEVE